MVRFWVIVVASVIFWPIHVLGGQTTTAANPGIDSDQDGLSDVLEQQLLQQFLPRFEVGRADCSKLPAEFTPGLSLPAVEAEDGTIYGQAFPARRVSSSSQPQVELHYYHLWRVDCGEHGHPLDAEHVSVLVRASENDAKVAVWKALYWYAAAHEQTVCDVSQVARATTLHAEDEGAKVWISPGKHASYLNEGLCSRGCGADRCEAMVPLAVARVINLGEVGHPMNGAVFVNSSQWQLALKMEQTNFPVEPLIRLAGLPDTEIAWVNPGRHPAQGVIAISGTTGVALANGASATASSLGVATDEAGGAISVAGDSTGSAFGKSYRKTVHALGASIRHAGRALELPEKPKSDAGIGSISGREGTPKVGVR